VVLSGASARIPRLRSLIAEQFVRDAADILCAKDPCTVVAVGAAMLGETLAHPRPEPMYGLHSLMLLSAGIETVGGVMTAILPRGTYLPVRRCMTFTTSQDFLRDVRIRLFQGEQPQVRDCSPLGELSLRIPPMLRGVPRIQVLFDVDHSDALTVTATEVVSATQARLHLGWNFPLAPQRIESMVVRAERALFDDLPFRAKCQTKHALEGLCYVVGSAARQGRLHSSVAKAPVLAAVDATLSWLQEQPPTTNSPDYASKQLELETAVRAVDSAFLDDPDSDCRRSFDEGGALVVRLIGPCEPAEAPEEAAEL
jgi:molecular chaperone DnaK (HSP70)